MVNEVLERCSKLGVRKVGSVSGLSVRELSRLLNGKAQPAPDTIAKLAQGIQKLEKQQQEHEQHVQDVIAAIKQRCLTISVRQFAEQAGVHYPHLIEVLTGKRTSSLAMLSKLEIALTAG